VGDGRTSIFFHTKFEKEPWVEIDRARRPRFSLVVVKNRR